MTITSERKLWLGAGWFVLLLGVAIMVASVVMLLNSVEDFDKTPSRVQAVGSILALCGVAALVLARVLDLIARGGAAIGGFVWTVFSYGTIIVGAVGGLVQAATWRNAVRAGLQGEGLTPVQKAIFIGGGTLVMAGVIALIAERAARQLAKETAHCTDAAGHGH